jgi:transposase
MKEEERKEALLEEYLQGGTSVRKLAQKYGMGISTVQRWLMAARKEKSKKRLSNAGKLPKPTEGMPEDVRQLQEELYNAQLKISLLEAMIDISDEQFGTDIRKKAGTRQS